PAGTYFVKVSGVGGAVNAYELDASITPTALAGQVQFGAPTYTATQGGPAAVVTVTRTGGSDGTVQVNYTTKAGTAVAGRDYQKVLGKLTFHPGETSKTITVPLGTGSQAGAGAVPLALSSPQGGASLGAQASAVLSITKAGPGGGGGGGGGGGDDGA